MNRMKLLFKTDLKLMVGLTKLEINRFTLTFKLLGLESMMVVMIAMVQMMTNLGGD